MNVKSALLLLVLLLKTLPGMASGLQDAAPVRDWIKRLSIRQDVQTREFRSVFEELVAYDSATICALVETLALEGPAGNKRFRIRLNAMKGLLGHFYHQCVPRDQCQLLFDEAVALAFEINDELLIADVCQWYARIIDYKKEIGKYSFYSVTAAEMQNKTGPAMHHFISLYRYRLGNLMYHTREYEKAILYMRQAMEWRLDTILLHIVRENAFQMMDAWNTIGLSYQKLGQYTEAFSAFDSSALWVPRADRPAWSGILAGNRGDTYFLMGDYDTAKPLLEYDYRVSMENEFWDNAANSLQWVARVNMLKGNARLALVQLYEAMAMLRRMPDAHYETNILFGLADAHKALGNIDSALIYTQRYLEQQNTLEREAAQARSEISMLRLGQQESIYRIKNMAKEKKQITLIRNFSIALIILISLAGYLYLTRQRLKMRLNEQKALEEKRLAETEAAFAKEQLQQFTQSLIEKTALIEKLSRRQEEQEIEQEQQQILADLSHHTILTDDDWGKFRTLFEQVHPGFFQRLRTIVPDITIAEQRMAALIRLHLSSKEAASLLGISAPSAIKTRQRLRMRLGVDTHTDLDQWITAV